MFGQLREQAEMSVKDLYTIRMRTSKVLAATDAFTALAAAIATVELALSAPHALARIRLDSKERDRFEQEHALLSGQLLTLRRRFAPELSLTTPPPKPKPKKPWWRVFG
jgi:hypothetical protein